MQADPLAKADELFRALGGDLATPEPELFSVVESDYESACPHRAAYTAQQFIKHQPEKARRVLFLLASNWGQNRIATTVGCGTRTVAEMAKLFPKEVANRKAKLAELAEECLALVLERIFDTVDAMKPDGLAMTAKLLVDTRAQLAGDAPAAAPQVHVHYTADDLRNLAMGLQGSANSPMHAIPARAVEIAPARDMQSLDKQITQPRVATIEPLDRKAGGEGVVPELPGGGSANAM